MLVINIFTLLRIYNVIRVFDYLFNYCLLKGSLRYFDLNAGCRRKNLNGSVRR